MGAARKARSVPNSPVKRSAIRQVSFTVRVRDSEGRLLAGILVELKEEQLSHSKSCTDKCGEVEFRLVTGNDYRIFVNNEDFEEVVGPRGDDEHEIEYDGEYIPNARGDDESESEDEEDSSDEEEDLDTPRDDLEDLDID